MFTNPQIEKYNKQLLQRFQDNQSWLFSENFKDSKFIEKEIDCYHIYYENDKFSENAFMFAFENLALYSYDRAIYFLIEQKSKEKFFEYFFLYSYYSYIAIHESSKGCKCLKGIPDIKMKRATHLFASTIISLDWDKAQLVGNDLINSLNAEGCIIRRGKSDALQAWFVIELFSKTFDVEINKRRALYPKDFSIYGDILKVWDSENLVEIDKHIYNLCDLHLTKHGKDKEEELQLLEIPSLLLFPFEVIAWLRLREYKGLKNPQEFTHPLMHEPMTKTLLGLNEPLQEPNEVPFLNEFLTYVYNHCPEMEKDKKFLENV